MVKLLLACVMLASPRLVDAAARPPNILWIMLDDLRPDALGCYGQPWANTPNMDRIAARGVLFQHAFAQNVVCRSSRLSMLTGQYCHALRDMEMGPEAERPPRYFHGQIPRSRIELQSALSQLGMVAYSIGKTHWHERWSDIPYAEPPRADL